MKTLLNYLASDAPMIDAADAHFFDSIAEGLHDRTVYDIIKWADHCASGDTG